LTLLDGGPRGPNQVADYLQTKTGFSINAVYFVGYNASGLTAFIYLFICLLCVARKKLTSYQGMIKVIHLVK
jgi:hypothetical protein